MADNVELNAGSGGDIIAADDVGGAKYQYVKPAFGANNTATIVSSSDPLPVVQTGALPSAGYSDDATFTPAASAHADGDCNGAAQEFTSMGPSGGHILITSVALAIANSSAEATAWRLHLYNVTPPSAIADADPWDQPSGDRASYLGSIDLPSTASDAGSTQYVEVNGMQKMVKLSGTSLFAYLVNLTALTPGNVAHLVRLHAIAV